MWTDDEAWNAEELARTPGRWTARTSATNWSDPIGEDVAERLGLAQAAQGWADELRRL